MRRLLVLVLLAGCSGQKAEPISGNACRSLLAGDLVITEIMANPAGEDDGKEWFEVYNAKGVHVDITGLELFTSKADGSGEKVHTIAVMLPVGTTAGLTLPPGYTVYGSAPAPLPPHVDYSYGDDLGALLNSDARLGLRCDGLIIDVVPTGTASDGVSRSLSGGAAPSAIANDNVANWCNAAADFETGSKGSPGAANPACGGVAGTTCDDNGTTREIKTPAAGELVISEIMPNPASTSDASGEWIEVTVLADVDLNGLELGTTAGTVRATLTDTKCRRRTAGAHVLLARVADSGLNGGLPAVEMTFNFDLSNAGGTVFIGAGGQILDETSWTGSGDGVSTSLSPEKLTPSANDDEASWCAAQTEYGDGDKGTPGAANDPCGDDLPDGQCQAGGVTRGTVAPEPGDLVITELFADPAGADTGKEWFEVLVRRDVDLNGLELGTAQPLVMQRLEGQSCLRVTAGSYLVFSHNDGASDDGGLPRVDFRTRFDLTNANPSVFLSRGGVLIDAVAPGAPTAGQSTSLSPDRLDPTENDEAASWCTASSPYGDGTGRGTPGAANSCAEANECLEGGVLRAVHAPQPGQLVISEVMPDPVQVGEEEGEWFELTLLADADLNGLQLGTTVGTPRQTIADAACRFFPAGSRLIFARNDVAAENGGLPRVDQRLGFGLVNSNGSLFVAAGDVLLDAVSWTQAKPGASISLDPDKLSSTTNDDPLAFCPARTVYGDGDKGTPGALNDTCPPAVGDGKCMTTVGVRDIVPPQPGDLVITEIMANPSGADGGKEWFEVLATRDVDLIGLELGTVFPTVSEQVEGPDCHRARAGTLIVFAGNNGALPDGGLPRVDQRFGFTLVNADRGIFLGRGGVLIDAATYGETADGASRSLSAGAQTAEGNEDQDSWCDATTSYGEGGNGTPGTANPACPPVLPDGMCLDGETVRATVKPAAGDLVITEILPDPTGADDEKEWFEVVAQKDVDLNGLQLGTEFPAVQQTLSRGPLCQRVNAGRILVFAHNDGSAGNGQLPRIDVRTTFALINEDRGVFLASDGALVDKITYAGTDSGFARNLSDGTDAAGNDDLRNWCNAERMYGFDNWGTPGRDNPRCPDPVGPGQCREVDGIIRSTRRPHAGDLVITEILSDPTGADTGKEWFEVYVADDVDLNGLQMGAVGGEPLETIDTESCRHVTTGSYLVFAHTDDATPDGGLPRVDVPIHFGLANDDRGLFLAHGGDLVDEASPPVETGVSRSLSGDTTDAAANDDDVNWCDAATVYGTDGNLGTPGAANPICVRPGQCREPGGAIRDADLPEPGDLVITEIFPDASGTDTGKEWFEVKVNADVDLNGLELGTEEGMVEQTIDDQGCLPVSAGTYLVFGQDAALSGLPRIDVAIDLGLGNTGGGDVFLGIGGTLIDEAHYVQAEEGVARSLSGDKIDDELNDLDASWCNAETPFGNGDLGTPGAANLVCLAAGQCRDGTAARAIHTPAVGDLVLTEIYPDPTAPETGKEWIEVLVKSAVDLNGVRLGTSPTTGTTYGTTSACIEVAPGYLVFANDGAAAHGGLERIDFSFGFTLNNGGGTLTLSAGATTLDAVTYADPPNEAVAIQLSADRLDEVQNDEQAFWCEAVDHYGAGGAGDGLGTPGAANRVCPFVVPTGKCAVGTELRDIDEPGPGELVITEVFPDAFGSDTGKQWFEAVATGDFDLNGLQLGLTPPTVRQTLTFDACQPVTAGTYLVFGDAGTPEVDHVITFNLLLPGATSGSDAGPPPTPGVWIGSGGTVVDAMTYTTAAEGVSRSLGAGKTSDDDNDDEGNWCDAAQLLAGGDRGTPGAANPVCPGPGQCLDHGTARPIDPPGTDDLVISEIMADPSKVADTAGEYIEVNVLHAADLTGMQLELNPGTAGAALVTVRTSDCVAVDEDSYVVFAHGADDGTNGGLGGVDFRFGFALPNGAATTLAVNAGDAFDETTYNGPTSGKARSLSDRRRTSAGNDTETSWCLATGAYGLGDLGTPGAANPNCPLEPDRCIEGGVERAVVAPEPGDLVIDEILANPAGTGTALEWVEIAVKEAVDLHGLSIGTTGDMGDTLTLNDDACRPQAAGTYRIFARSAAPDGIAAGDIEAVHGFDLLDSTSTVFISRAGVTLDEAVYTATDGRSYSLDPDHVTPADNDGTANWCLGVGVYGAGGQGTPGHANAECLQAGECIDPDDDDARPINPPEVGDLVITELMINPSGTDTGLEWIELYAVNGCDLNDLVLHKTSATPDPRVISSPAGMCLEAHGGEYFLLASNASILNADYVYPSAFTLNQTNSGVALDLPTMPAATTIDLVTYGTTNIPDGASRVLRQSLREMPDANNDASGGNWCTGTTLYDGVNRGSPGLPNETDFCQ